MAPLPHENLRVPPPAPGEAAGRQLPHAFTVSHAAPMWQGRVVTVDSVLTFRRKVWLKLVVMKVLSSASVFNEEHEKKKPNGAIF